MEPQSKPISKHWRRCCRLAASGVFICGVAPYLAAAAPEPAPGATETSISMIGPAMDTGLEGYTKSEVQRVFRKGLNVSVAPTRNSEESRAGSKDVVVIGTLRNNDALRRLVDDGFLREIAKAQGYSLRCAPHPRHHDRWVLAILGADDCGALYGLRDLEHYHLKRFKVSGPKVMVDGFSAADYPRIEYRAHWVWGVNMPDKRTWLENMSRWKLNELIHWDNFPPAKAKEYVEFAHSRGIRLVWGFGWGWNPDWNFKLPPEFDHGVGAGVQVCSSSEFNRAFFRREILKKVRELYVPTGCDGIYFQSFTEMPKCQCDKCRDKAMGRLLLEFVSPIVADIKQEFPDLWVSCGVHANYGVYNELKQLDPRCNLYWENCDSGTSIRGGDEDFGYINKMVPYGGGFTRTCPADPSYTEESLLAWIQSNEKKYTLPGSREAYYDYLRNMQRWSRQLLGRPSTHKHACCVGDHSVFCRRTPFLHLALAEALWNPERDAQGQADAMVDFLGLRL